MQFIDVYDYLLLPLYLFAFYFIVVIKSRKFGHEAIRQYMIIGFFLHMLGSFMYCMVIQYYYGFGDSFGFYLGSNFIRDVIDKTGDPINAFFTSSAGYEKWYPAIPGLDQPLPTGIDVDSNLTVMKISALLSYVTFNSYLIISMFFGLFSVAGLWKLYKTMNEVLQKKAPGLLAIFILCAPSVCFWGSGLIKDSICLGCIGFIVHYCHNILVKKRLRIKEIVLLALLSYLLFIIKPYLGASLGVAFILGYVIYIIKRYRKDFIKLAAVGIMLIAAGIALMVVLSSTLDSIINDSKDNIETFKEAYQTEDEFNDVSSFATANVDISIEGILLQSPLAVFTTLYRPFPWESGKLVMFFSALESLLMLMMLIYVLAKCHFWRFFRLLISDPYCFLAFVFVMIMGVIVGLSTFNFGTMVRYRLPMLPFYCFMLLSIYIRNKAWEQKNLKD